MTGHGAADSDRGDSFSGRCTGGVGGTAQDQPGGSQGDGISHIDRKPALCLLIVDINAGLGVGVGNEPALLPAEQHRVVP